jgi:hypothetical protein
VVLTGVGPLGGGRALPSSTGELSQIMKTRPLPYWHEAAITPVVLVCARPFIHTSPRSVGLEAG